VMPRDAARRSKRRDQLDRPLIAGRSVGEAEC
jgi:hypothetical protein